MIHYETDEQNIVQLILDMPDRSVNVVNEVFGQALARSLNRLVDEEELAGVVITSGKSTFIAGGDIDLLYQLENPQEAFEMVERLKGLFRQLELLGKPVVAAINGSALGGGLELALSCHYRVAIDDPKIRLGFPEVTLGLLPGGGGIVRLTRLIGLQPAFPYLIEGRQVSPEEAKQDGIIHELASDREELLAKAKSWIMGDPEAAQPWDKKGFRMPGGDPRKPAVAQMVSVAPAMVKQKTYGNYPAPESILSAMVEGAVVDFDTASRIESRYFTKLATGQTAKNMIKAFWYQLNEIKGGRSRPEEIDPVATTKVGVLGAGMMGHGIAYVSALAGMDVVLKDVTIEKAMAGKHKADTLVDGRVRQGRLIETDGQAAKKRIRATENVEDLAGCDLIIEAVFEDRGLKARVTQEAEARVGHEAVFGSNTSTLPITGLAKASVRPENFIGIHFFSPVHKMRLVELIVGEQTSNRTLAKAFDYVLKIGKTPIVVNDSRGFYTSRVFTTYIYEGMRLLNEGQPAAAIEMAGLKAGMPVGPLAVSDEVNLGLAMSIREQTRKDLLAEGREVPVTAADRVLDLMVKDAGRLGKAQGAGFYSYPQGGKKHLWGGLAELFPPAEEQLGLYEMIDRLLFVQSLEAVRCFDEGVVTSVADANIGSIFGWGFAPFKGGTLQFVNSYGLTAFLRRCHELSDKFGDRFQPPDRLLKMEQQGQSF